MSGMTTLLESACLCETGGEVREAIEALLADADFAYWAKAHASGAEARRLFLAILDAHASEAAPVVGLSEAWAKAEAALPEGWFLHGVKRGYVGANATPSGPRWSASAIQGGIGVDTRHHGTVPSQSGSGPTPADALLNLAARLTQTRTLGTDGGE